MQNNSGVHGQFEFSGAINVHMSSECIVVEGNQATIGAQITQVGDIPPGSEGVFVVGNYIYVMVEDNGEGNGAPSDRYSARLYYSPEAFGPLCAQIPPSGIFCVCFSEEDGNQIPCEGDACDIGPISYWDPIVDTFNESDQIQVKD